MNNLKAKKSILQIVAILLTIIFVINLLVLFIGIKSYFSYDYGYDYSEMQRALEDKDYPLLSDMVQYNEVKGLNKKEKTSEFMDDVKKYENDLIQDAYKKAEAVNEGN